MRIGAHEIGRGHPVFVVAEIGPNHIGSYALATQLVREAAKAGASAVKFQVYTPDELTCDSDHPAYRMTSGPWKGRKLFDLYTDAMTPWEWMPPLMELADSLGMVAFASVFGPASLDYMESLGCPAFKIASAEVEDLDFVRLVASKGKPVILSDGLGREASNAATGVYARTTGDHSCQNVAVLRCVSAYPATPDSYGLEPARDELGDPLPGLSDHTLGTETAVAAVALGACIVEKHLRLASYDYPQGERPHDYDHSIAPQDFASYVRAIRATEAMVNGKGERGTDSEQWRRRLVFARDLPAGHVLTREDVRTARCGEGTHPNMVVCVLGNATPADVKAGDPVRCVAVPVPDGPVVPVWAAS